MPNKQSGYTLASLAVTLFIISILYLNVNRDNQVRMNVVAYDTVVLSAEVLSKAVNTYYFANCNLGSTMPSPTVNDLISDGYLSSPESIYNNLDLIFTPQIVDPGTPDSLIYLTTNAPNSSVAQQIVEQATNASRFGSTVTFTYKPSTSNTYNQTRVSEMKRYFGESYCR